MGQVMRRIYIFGGGIGVVLATCSFAIAADLRTNLPTEAPVRSAIYDWTGFYIGAHIGSAWASEDWLNAGLFDPFVGKSLANGTLNGFLGGFQAVRDFLSEYYGMR